MQVARQVQSQQALGGTATIGIIIADTTDVTELFREVWMQVFTFERQFSRFLTSSELSQFNAKAGLKVPVSQEFITILRAASDLAKRTKGTYNPFVLPAVQRMGYRGSAVAEYANDPTPDYTERHVTTPDKLEIGEDWARIPHGTAIDLGGCGKGYLADQVGAFLRESGAQGYWVELSGDIATFGCDEHGEALTVAIKNAFGEGNLDAVVTCPFTPFGIATSGTFKRVAIADQLRGHHIIDPKTARPAETDILLATVCAPTALEADVFASCAVIAGSKHAPSVLSELGATSWLLQYTAEGKEQRLHHGPDIPPLHKDTPHA